MAISPLHYLPTLRRIGPALMLATAAACATSQGARFDSHDPAAASPIVLIENHGFTDVHVYALAGNGKRVRLGRVNALESFRVRLPAALRGARYLRLQAEPTLLGTSYTSEQVLIEEGTEVVWMLENELSMSKLFLR